MNTQNKEISYGDDIEYLIILLKKLAFSLMLIMEILLPNNHIARRNLCIEFFNALRVFGNSFTMDKHEIELIIIGQWPKWMSDMRSAHDNVQVEHIIEKFLTKSKEILDFLVHKHGDLFQNERFVRNTFIDCFSRFISEDMYNNLPNCADGSEVCKLYIECTSQHSFFNELNILKTVLEHDAFYSPWRKI